MRRHEEIIVFGGYVTAFCCELVAAKWGTLTPWRGETIRDLMLAGF